MWEYALDTKNFHEPSHALPIIPVLVPTRWQSAELPPRQFAADGSASRYKPTPTIIEGARHLYANHSVADIVRTEADERNLSDTARRVEALIQQAQANNEKIICFVTGVPGAGKTHVTM